jgi:hypothetical protein
MEQTSERARKDPVVYGLYELFKNDSVVQNIGKFCSAHPKFRPELCGKGLYITYVWVSLRSIAVANHWAVIFKLSNGKYGITQLDTSGGVELLDNYGSLESASWKTWGQRDHVRLSCYGSCYESYDRFVKSLLGTHVYILGLHDGQNYAREIVKQLTGKVVGVYPIEDGPKFGQKNIPTLDKIADEAGPAVVFAAINPFYWIARAFD